MPGLHRYPLRVAITSRSTRIRLQRARSTAVMRYKFATRIGRPRRFFDTRFPNCRQPDSRDRSLMHAAESGFVEQTFGTGPGGAQQLTSFAVGPHTQILSLPNAVGFYDKDGRRLTMIAWDRQLVKSHIIQRHDRDALLTLTLARDVCEISYGTAAASSAASAQAVLRTFANRRPSTP